MDNPHHLEAAARHYEAETPYEHPDDFHPYETPNDRYDGADDIQESRDHRADREAEARDIVTRDTDL